jgi:hypothetical protein
MGVNPDYTQLDNFMPTMTIPSEQLLTAFSRLMWRELYEKPENAVYYELHMNTMYNLGLVDHISVNMPSKLADFVVITARALEKKQLLFEEVSALESVEAEKAKYRFW